MPDPVGGTPASMNFSSQEGRFRIGLPGGSSAPESEGNGKSFRWLIINGGVYQVFYLDREVAVDTPEVSESLVKIFREQASSRGRLVGDSEINRSGHPCHEFRIETDGGLRVERLHLAGNRVYVVAVFVPSNWSCKTDSAVKVLETFEIIDETNE